jgi:hypothetical protein
VVLSENVPKWLVFVGGPLITPSHGPWSAADAFKSL